jgi:5-formaminoimidazole-4-carboxamide-1-beta-D-ribofuranosyl 5'-monophosphate synthetase
MMANLLTGDNLIDFAKTIKSKQEFEYFTTCLLEDYLKNKAEWENDSLEEYLFGLSRFSVDMAGYYENLGEDIDVTVMTWRIAAEMLIAASVYGN